jgi:hypothetical protein
MAYSTLERVEELLPEVWIDHTTHPTRDDVTGWLDDIDGQINVALASGGNTVPVTDADMLKNLDLLEGKEAAYLVMQAKGVADDDENPALWQQYHKDFLAALEAFATPGETSTSAGAGAATPSALTDVTPHLTREKVY